MSNNRREFFRIQDEFSMLIFEQLVEKLAKNGLQAEVAEHPQGGTVLKVSVPGPEEIGAEFRITQAENGSLVMDALYISTLLPEGCMATWELGTDPNTDELAELFIPEYITECLMEEHDKFCKFTLIVEENKEEFIDLLPDEAFTEENLYAAGVIVEDEDGPEAAGVIVFSFVAKDDVELDYIFVDPKYGDMGIETYMINALARLVASEDEE